MTTMTIPDVSISPTILTRIGGLPVDAVPGASAEIGACLERLDHIEETLDELAQPLIDRIFDVVPTIEDPKARRLVLQAKRQVFAGKAVQARAAEALRANAPAGVASAFDAWEAVRAEREDLESRLEALLGADDDAMRDALTRTVSDTAYLSSLALATPELVDRLIHHKPGRKPSERLVRSLYNYATRTALKTSPFSGLTTVNVAGAVGRGRSTQTVAMHLASGLLHQAARASGARPHALPRWKGTSRGARRARHAGPARAPRRRHFPRGARRRGRVGDRRVQRLLHPGGLQRAYPPPPGGGALARASAVEAR